MFNYLIKIEYIGTKFVGWQYQKNGSSVQEKIEKALKKIFPELKFHFFDIAILQIWCRHIQFLLDNYTSL